MTIEAAAPAPVTDTPIVAADIDAELMEIYNRDSKSPEFKEEQAEPAAEASVDTPADPPAETVAEVEMPRELPLSLKPHWSSIPEAARAELLEAQREMGRKLSEQGRLVSGIAPIRDVLSQAVKDLPELSDMRPADVAREVFELAKISAQFKANPADTIIGLIQKHNIGATVLEKLSGQPQSGNTDALMAEIGRLKEQLGKVADPQYLRQTFSQITTETQVSNVIEEFASGEGKDHWAAVEDHMPNAIQFIQAKLGPGASPRDVLAQAYQLAVSQFVQPPPQAPVQEAAPAAAVVADPLKAEAARQAKSVNVSGKPTAERVLTEDELLLKVYNRAQAR